MEQLVLLPKMFEFSEENRSRLSFSDTTKIRLSVEDRVLMLKRVTPAVGRAFDAPVYPVNADIYVKTWLATPQAATRWVDFDYWGSTPEGTSIGFRLSPDGTHQKIWSGTEWRDAVDGHMEGTIWVPSEWNTVQQIRDHIGSFPVATKAIQVIANLVTTDPTVTPSMEGVGVLYEAFIDQYYDINEGSMMPYLESLRPKKDWAVRLIDAGSYIDLVSDSEYSLDPFNVVDVVEAYDNEADPHHQTNLRQSYDPVTKRLTFTASQPAGAEVWLRFTYQAETAIITNQDFGVSKIPSVVVEGIDELDSAPLPDGILFRNRATGEGTLVKSPLRANLRYSIRITADRQRDVAAILSALLKKLRQEPLLVSVNTDEKYSLNIQRSQGDYGGPDLSDVSNKRVVIDILNVNYWVAGTRTVKLVTSGLKGTGDLTFTSGTID